MIVSTDTIRVSVDVDAQDFWERMFNSPVEVLYPWWRRINADSDYTDLSQTATIWYEDANNPAIVCRRKGITIPEMVTAYQKALEYESPCCDYFGLLPDEWDVCCVDFVLQFLVYGEQEKIRND